MKEDEFDETSRKNLHFDPKDYETLERFYRFDFQLDTECEVYRKN